MTKHSRSLFEKMPAGTEFHPPAEDLARYVDSLRNREIPRLPPGLVSHVENCSHCQGQILDVFFYLQDPLKEPDTARVRKAFPAKKHVFWLPTALRLAAALFVFTLLLSFYFFLPRHQAQDSIAPSQPDASPPPAIAAPALPAKDLAPEPRSRKAGRPVVPAAQKRHGSLNEKRDAFAVNPNLESMVGSRSRGLVIEVYSPPNHVSLSQEITFSWKEFSREPLSLTIVNNRNETIFKNPVSGGAFQFQTALPSGCYYWKLESTNELYYVGKFFVSADATFPKE